MNGYRLRYDSVLYNNQQRYVEIITVSIFYIFTKNYIYNVT